MGGVTANVIVSNPANRNRRWEGQFLVDTGATDSLVPRQHLEAIGIRPEGQRTYVLADGTEIRMDIAVARIELMREIAGGTVLFGNERAEPLLGVTALESLGIEIDPLNQQLKKLPAVRLKQFGKLCQKEHALTPSNEQPTNMKLLNIKIRPKTIQITTPVRGKG